MCLLFFRQQVDAKMCLAEMFAQNWAQGASVWICHLSTAQILILTTKLYE